MKRFIIFSAIFFVLVVSGCKKSTSTTGSGDTYKGVIIKNICCQIVIQTIGPNYIGQTWKDGSDSSAITYNHVFKVSNPCQFGNHISGDTINLKIVPLQVQNCACCMVYVSTPDTAYPIEVLN